MSTPAGQMFAPPAPGLYFRVYLSKSATAQRNGLRAAWMLAAQMTTAANSDEALVRRIAGGDRDAMRLLFNAYNAPVFRYILRMVRNAATADDLIADVFMDVWQQADRFEGRSSVRTWLIGIARFKALSALRKSKHTSLDDEMAETIVDEADDPEVVKQKQDKGQLLRRCLTLLSREHSEIVDLVYYHEMSIEEAAAVTGIPENTVKTRLFHARKKLAEIAKANGLDRGWP